MLTELEYGKYSIRDAVVYANEVPVKFKGVNRHDSDPVTGFVNRNGTDEKDLQMNERA